jgi:aryl-alcohol dehydrogenase-like predicted oxidoreductase
MASPATVGTTSVSYAAAVDRFRFAVGIEDTFVPHAFPGHRALDEYELTQHYRFWSEDLGLAAETGAGLVVRDPLAPRLDAAARERLRFLERDRGQTLDQALVRFALADPAVATVLVPVPDRAALAELAAAPDLPAPTGEDLALLAELQEARFGVGAGGGR